MIDSGETWWRNGIFYQIYPRSFQGLKRRRAVGDIAGIVHRLPYLSALGVDAIWLSPIFPHRWPISVMTFRHTGIDSIFATCRSSMRSVTARISAA